MVWPCNINRNSKMHKCPKGYSCLVPTVSTYLGPVPHPKYLTKSGSQQSYCCPLIPKITLATVKPSEKSKAMNVFDSVCLHGKASNVSLCANGYYSFPGIGRGPVCCPEPCIPHPVAGVVVRDGICTYEAIK